MSEVFIKNAVKLVSKELENWNDRSPAIIVSALRDYSIPTVFEIVSETPETKREEFLLQTLANLILSRYAEVGYRLDQFHSELLEVFESNDKRIPMTVSVLEKIKTISYHMQHSGTHKHQSAYYAIGRLATEFLEKVDPDTFAFQIRRTVLLEHTRARKTQELEETEKVRERSEKLSFRARNTGSLKISTGPTPRHQTAQDILHAGHSPYFIIDIGQIDHYLQRRETLQFWLPRIFELLETWEPTHSPLQMAELLQPLSVHELLQFSAYLMPHRNQNEYLKILGILMHLNHLLDTPLSNIQPQMAHLLKSDERQVLSILPQVIYRIYCSSITFYAIQEKAIKKLGFQRNYLYHLVTLEWAKNKAISESLRFHEAAPPTLKQVEHLAQTDWEFIFLLLNQGLARSVIKDVYGIFHGSTAFAEKIVDPDTSKGFGHGVRSPITTTSLATRQIFDLLAEHSQLEFEMSDRVIQFQQFAQERFRRLILRSDPRPLLNMPTLNRIQQYVHQLFQRGQEKYLSYETISFWVARECLSGFSHLFPDKFGWLVYDLVTYTLQASQQLGSRLDECVRGLIGALLAFFSEELYQQRPLEAEGIFHACWHGFFHSIQDTGLLDLHSLDLTRKLQELGLETIQRLRDRHLAPYRREQLESIVHSSPNSESL